MTENLFDRKLLRARKHRFANKFSEHNFLHHEIGQRLIENLELQSKSFNRILEIGAVDDFFIKNISCESFFITSLNRLKIESFNQDSRKIKTKNHKHPQNFSKIYSLICDDEALPFKRFELNSQENKLGFDLIISHLNLQFINHLPKLLFSINKMLNIGGIFTASFFGERNLWQLAQSIFLAQNKLYGGVSPIMPPTVEIKTSANLLLQAGFKNSVSDLEKIEVNYSSLSKLLSDLKFCSANNLLVARQKNRLFSRRFLKEIEKIYKKEFGKIDNHSSSEISASFEILTISGEK